MEVYAGTSGWAYATWKPDFYPQELPQSRFLSYYSEQLNTVEVNYTFRHRLLPGTTEKWLKATPENFRFSFKAHQAITHFRRLKDIDEPLVTFLESILPFYKASRLGVLLFQLPASMKCDVGALSEILEKLPPSFRCAFEFRHESWLVDEVFDNMRRHNVALCITRGREELPIPEIQTADFLYYRLRGDFGSYKPRSFLKELKGFAAKASFVYFKHEETSAGATRASQLLATLKASQEAA
jgi:uncharacterized protein YecE (DUF72 family)